MKRAARIRTAPGSLDLPPYTNEGDYATVWDGNRMHIPGGVDDELLINTEAKLPALADGNTYPWVTKSYYRLSCLASTANGYPGEAFVAVTPNGERYTFNWAVVHTAPALNVGQSTFLNRSRIFLLATEVQDRFGNWVKYTYNGDQLTRITASDGREIDITWSGNTVVSANAGSRTWSYGYSGGMLKTVTRPERVDDGPTPLPSGSLATTMVGSTPTAVQPPHDHCQLEPDRQRRRAWSTPGGRRRRARKPRSPSISYDRHYRHRTCRTRAFAAATRTHLLPSRSTRTSTTSRWRRSRSLGPGLARRLGVTSTLIAQVLTTRHPISG